MLKTHNASKISVDLNQLFSEWLQSKLGNITFIAVQQINE